MKNLNLKNKKVVVVGLGESGMGAAILLSNLGAKPAVTDNKDDSFVKERLEKIKDKLYDFEIGKHTREFLKGANFVVKSPGITGNCPVFIWAREYGIPVIGEIELAANFCPGKIVAVTGTNGKSTTVSLTKEIFKDAKKKVVLCGNIGNSFCANLPKIDAETIVVVEISSFQLEDTRDFKPNVAVILNISQNHLDRYTDFNQYLFSKFKIAQNQAQNDWTIINYDDNNLKARFDFKRTKMLFFSKDKISPGAFIKGDFIYFDFDKRAKRMRLDKDNIYLKGEHNLENILAASLVGAIFDVPIESIASTISNFRGLEHRFEYAGSIKGVKFINDSKATSVDAASRALLGCREPVILIAGGRDKGSDFTTIRKLIKDKVKSLILLGEAKDKIRDAFKDIVNTQDAQNLEDAVKLAFKNAKEGDCVLLSPMCASFDMFQNFEHRGRVFKEIVKRLKTKDQRPKIKDTYQKCKNF